MEKKKIVIYIAGPVIGVDKYWEAFEKVDDDLTGRGYIVLNPARLPSDLSHAKAMTICMAMVEAADMVVLLPGWEKSKGATLEKGYAEKLGKPAMTLPEFSAISGVVEWLAGVFDKAVRE